MTQKISVTGQVKDLRNLLRKNLTAFLRGPFSRAWVIVAFGSCALCGQPALAGDLDTTFGQGGCVSIGFSDLRLSSLGDPGLTFATAKGIAVQAADGKIVVAGTASDASLSRTVFALARFNKFDGSLDTTFGGALGR